MLVLVYSTTLQLKFSTFRRRSNLFKKLVDTALNKKVSSLIFRKYKRLKGGKLLKYGILFEYILKIKLKELHRMCPHAPLPL